jgi:hypothetical protein
MGRDTLEAGRRRSCLMSMSRLTAILASIAFLAPSGMIPTTGDGPKSPPSAVAGDYYCGQGAGFRYFLSVKPDGRFSFVQRDCNSVFHQNTGGAKLVAGHLILLPERPDNEGLGSTPTDLHVVRWDDRLYLIPDEGERDFCNAVNQGREPRPGATGRFYLRQGDWEKQVAGLPSVPKAWESLLLKGPLRGRVIDVLSGGRARVDLGADAGVWKGMELWADTDGFGLVKVVEIGARSSVIASKYPDYAPIRFQMAQVVRSRPVDQP